MAKVENVFDRKVQLLSFQQCTQLRNLIYSKQSNIHPGLINFVVMDYCHRAPTAQGAEWHVYIPNFKDCKKMIELTFLQKVEKEAVYVLDSMHSKPQENCFFQLHTLTDVTKFIETLSQHEDIQEKFGEKELGKRVYDRLLNYGPTQFIPIHYQGESWFLINPESNAKHDNGNPKVTSWCFCIKHDCSEVHRMNKNVAVGHALFFGESQIKPWLFYKK